MILKTKTGANRILSVYWFAILVLVSVGIFSIVFSFQTPYDVRELEASVLTGQVADCLAPQGVIDSNIVSKLKSEVAPLTSCKTDIECQQATGGKIIEIVREMKPKLVEDYPNIDASIFEEGVAENLECLVVQIAFKESGSLKHCKNREKDGDPFYCDGKKPETLQSGDTDKDGNSLSWGIMQIYKNKHPDSTPEDFDLSVKYATEEVLIDQYNLWGAKGRSFSSTVEKREVIPIPCSRVNPTRNYKGWKAAIRGYNGWNACESGNVNYVEDIVALRGKVEKLFPTLCSPGRGISLSKQCNLNFENIDEKKDPQYYVRVDFVNLTSGNYLASVAEGNPNWATLDLTVQKEKEFSTLSKSVKRSFYSVDENNEKYLIKILSAVRKTEQNVK